jgi:hypothetical protein
MSVASRVNVMALAVGPRQPLAWIAGLLVLGSAAGFAQDPGVQITDIGVSGDFEVSASFTIVSRGDVPAAAQAEAGHLYVGDEASLDIRYKGAKLFEDAADLSCSLNSTRPDGEIEVIDCSDRLRFLDYPGTQGEYFIGFLALPTDPGGLWLADITVTDLVADLAVTVEIRFEVHTEVEV